MHAGGGFHGYRRLQQTSSDINMRLPEMNTPIDINDDNNLNMNNECTVREQDRFMPIANVIRIMRKTLPTHAKISDDAKETIQECVSEFISFVTSEANDRCQKEQRKTITAEDVLWAMTKLGFDDYIDPLTFYLHRFREMEGDRGAIRGEGPMMMKRGREFGPMGVFPGFGPEFYTGHHNQQHQHGLFGGGDSNAGSSQGGGVNGVGQPPPPHGHRSV